MLQYLPFVPVASAYVLADLMSENADLRDVIEGVLAMDPEQAPVILARLFDPIRLQVTTIFLMISFTRYWSLECYQVWQMSTCLSPR